MKIKRIIMCIVIIVFFSIVTILNQHSYEMEIVSVQIPTSKGTLSGKMVLPKHSEAKVGLVIFIHGDGPANATYDGQYEPLWEELATQGYASLSWSKPGIDGSSGNWLSQSMEDRATEALEVMNWARSHPRVDSDRIGLWGSSQAGWVIPKINRQDQHIAFNILVAPAINWVEQGLYNTTARLQQTGESVKKIEQAQQQFLWSVSILDQGLSYEEYQNHSQADKSMTEDRWNFILRNYKSDATEDLRHFYSPVKLFLGGKDIHVDSVDTKKVYEAEVPAGLLSTTMISSTDHYMLKPVLVNSSLLTTLTGLFAPRQLAHRDYYAGIRAFLQSLEE